MTVDFGAAFAQGLAQGIGQAGLSYVDDMRRARQSDRDMANRLNMFKQQQSYTQRMKAVEAENVTADTWKAQAAKDTGTIAYELATKMSEPFSKEDRPRFFRDSMKQLNGLSKAELLARGGYVMPDYSQFTDDPTLMEAIPQMNLIGTDGPDTSMQEVFKYDPKAYQEVQAKKAEKINQYTQKRDDDIEVINTMAQNNYGSTLSPEAAKLVWKQSGGARITQQGATVSSMAVGLVDKWVQKGILVDTGTELKMRSELTPDEQSMFLGVSPEGAPAEAPKIEPDIYEDPTKAAYLDKQEVEKQQKAMDANIKGLSKDLGTGKGTPLTTHTELTEARDELNAMSDDALDYLFQVGFSNETVRDLAAKFGDEEAQKAKDVIAKMSGSVNSIRHQLFGSALTEGEAEAFRQQFSNIGAFNSKENLISQLDNLINKAELGVTEKMAGYDEKTRKEFLRRNPQYQGVMSQVSMGESEGTPEGTKQTLSDLSVDISMLEAEDQAAIREALSSGLATEEDVKAYIASLQ